MLKLYISAQIGSIWFLEKANPLKEPVTFTSKPFQQTSIQNSRVNITQNFIQIDHWQRDKRLWMDFKI